MSAAAEELRERWRRVRLPAGLPPLMQSLRLAVVLLDGDDAGFAMTIAPDWSIAPTDHDRDVVYDGALAAPGELVHAICTGTLDPGHAVFAGGLTGTMASQSVLAYLLEAVATLDVAASSEGNP